MYYVTPHKQISREVLEPRNLRGVINDLDSIIKDNDRASEIIEQKDSGRPGHYWGRDVVAEGSMPIVAFLLSNLEYDEDPDWWRDDRKFQDFMTRHPEYSWLKRR